MKIQESTRGNNFIFIILLTLYLMIASPRKGGVESSQALHDKLFQLVALSDGSDHIEYLCWEASHLTPHLTPHT